MIAAQSRPALSRPALSRAQLIAAGLLWGAALTTVESFNIPFDNETIAEIASFVLLVGGPFCIAGLVLAVGATVLEPHWSAPLLALFTVFVAAAEAAIHLVALNLAYMTGEAIGMQALFAHPRSSLTVFLYCFWLVGFYGGLFVTALVLNARAHRRRALLTRLQITADQTEAAGHHERMNDLNGGLPQSLLVDAVATLQRFYDNNDAGADSLLNDLVAFFRAANTSLVSGVSTLAGEIALAQAYGEVRQHLSGRSQIHFTLDSPLPELPFPAPVLVPAIDQLLASGADEPVVEVTCRRDGDGWRLRLSGAGRLVTAWPEAGIENRLRAGLSPHHLQVTVRRDANLTVLDILIHTHKTEETNHE